VHVDSSTAKSIASRTGVGKLRHVETKILWTQEAVKNGRLVLEKMKVAIIPANPLTKPLGLADVVAVLADVGANPIRRLTACGSVAVLTVLVFAQGVRP
jgi:hypothetical protein